MTEPGTDGPTSFWSRTLDAARRQHGWMLVPRHYTRATAAQIATDITRAAHRDPAKLRVKGIRPGERWDARWSPADSGAPGDHVVWIRLAASDTAEHIAFEG